jgi:hypothetical protein
MLSRPQVEDPSMSLTMVLIPRIMLMQIVTKFITILNF